MKTLNLKLTLATMAAIGFLLGSGSAYSQTAAELPVDNLATLTFSVGGGAALVIESDPAGNTDIGIGQGVDTSFLVDRIIDFQIVEVNGTWNDATENANVSAGQNNVYVMFELTNQSNSIMDFDLSAVVNGAGLTNPPTGYAPTPTLATPWTPTLSGIYADNTGTGTAAGAVANAEAFVDELAIGGVINIYVEYDIPAAAIQDQGFLVTLIGQAAGSFDASGLYVATAGAVAALVENDSNSNESPGVANVAAAADDATIVQSVFNEALGVPGEEGELDIVASALSTTFAAVSTINNGQFGATAGILIDGARLDVTKTAETIWDPLNANVSEKAIPGAYVRYTVTIENNGGATANLTTIADSIDTEVIFDTGLMDDLACVETTLPGACLDENGVAYSVAGTTGVQLEWDAVIGSGADATTYVASGTAFAGSALSLALDTAILTTGNTGNTADGDLDAGQSVTISYNVIIQ